MRVKLRAILLASLAVASPAIAEEPATATGQPQISLPASSDEMKLPHVSEFNADWAAVRIALAALDGLRPHDEETDLLAGLNTITAKAFSAIATSPVPVLLPFDTPAYLHDAANGNSADVAKYLSGFASIPIFFPGPSGYDALVTLAPPRDLTFAKPVEVEITGSAMLYELDGAAAPQGEPVSALDAKFPGIRRSLVESRVRYTFTRFGVPYVVGISCFDGPSSTRRLSCREADKVALRVLDALNIVGGAPPAVSQNNDPHTVDRPTARSPDFAYFAPGDLIPGTGVHGQLGRADATVYGKLRFPMAQPPAYALSQAFMNWGNCDLTGRVGLSGHTAYRCRVNDRPLVNDESRNFAYPWRDNFCEHRAYEVGQCPAGVGHQGQDIRPAHCIERDPASGRCEPYQDDVVAVSDGVLMRSPGDLALYLLIDKPGEHIRVRYLHMNPHMLDAAGMVSGRKVVEGEVLGSVGTYETSERGTSYHLHFDAQVPTRSGWVFFNPYMTLVAAYERLIGARGQVVTNAPIASQSPSTANPADGLPAAPADTATSPKPGDTTVTDKEPSGQAKATVANVERCTIIIYHRYRRRICRSISVESASGGDHDRAVSQPSPRPRYRGRYVHVRHGRTSS